MKKLLFVLMCAITVTVYGNTTDSLKIVALQREVSNLKVSVSRLQQEDQRQLNKCELLQGVIDSLKLVQAQQARGMDCFEDSMRLGFSTTKQNLQESKDTLSDLINNRTWMAVCGILMTLLLLGVLFFILKKRISSGSSAIDKIKSVQEGLESAQKAMQEESVKLDSKLVELLDKQLKASNMLTNDNLNKPDHRFALKVGDEIAKIETNLSRMDPTVRGYNQLKQAVRRIKDNFNAQGYEIVELLGLDYNDGMPFEAQFVPDDTLPEGKRVISGITRLQINYNGEMIQSAKIVVRQNI